MKLYSILIGFISVIAAQSSNHLEEDEILDQLLARRKSRKPQVSLESRKYHGKIVKLPETEENSNFPILEADNVVGANENVISAEMIQIITAHEIFETSFQLTNSTLLFFDHLNDALQIQLHG
jgi:predicted transcriptional regulator